MYKIKDNPNEFNSLNSLVSYALDTGIDPSTEIYCDGDYIGTIEDYLVF